MVDEVNMRKIKDVIVGTREAGTVISRRIAIAIGNGVLKANNPKLLKEYGGHIKLTEGWARKLLKSMNCVKRKCTTGKVEPSAQFLREEKLTFQRGISDIVEKYEITPEMVLNLDQTPLAYVSPGKFTFAKLGSNTVPIKGVDDKRQIRATFVVSAVGEFLPMQLIHQGTTKRCLPKFEFLESFDVTQTPNHWSNEAKS